jgi:hypothetical protein
MIAAAPAGASDDKVELVCANGHRMIHPLARVGRLNVGWCGTCGADLRYLPMPGSAQPAAGSGGGVANDSSALPDGSDGGDPATAGERNP